MEKVLLTNGMLVRPNNDDGCDGYCESYCCGGSVSEEYPFCGRCNDHADTACSECDDPCIDYKTLG